ncbi:BP74-related protein [Dyella mobilis]|nr:hypothetical protein [Dyella mobilis]
MNKLRMICALAVVVSTVSMGAQAQERYFRMSDGHPANDFIFMLKDPAKIKQAESIIACSKDPACRSKGLPHVSGTIVISSAPYNSRWGFHYEPKTIAFPDFSVEVCDANTSYVQEHLAEVGGHFLPGNRWCPWGQRVVEDVTATISSSGGN